MVGWGKNEEIRAREKNEKGERKTEENFIKKTRGKRPFWVINSKIFAGEMIEMHNIYPCVKIKKVLYNNHTINLDEYHFRNSKLRLLILGIGRTPA